jgi:hypothetical protein
MIEITNKILGLFRGISSLGSPRSSLWRRTREEHLKSNPECAVCGRKKNLVPHHVIPVHVDPSKELDPENLITLCEGPSFNCHLFFGHLRDWTKFNPEVKSDAEGWKKRLL